MRQSTNQHASEIEAEIPVTLDRVLDQEWLEAALSTLSGGGRVVSVEPAEVVKTMASKIRVKVAFKGGSRDSAHLCIKGFLDHDLGENAGGVTTLREADFYLKIAPNISMETPPCRVVVADREASRCIFIMDDMVAAGAHFYSALEPLTVDQTAETLEQLARLHAAHQLLPDNPWIPNRIQSIALNGGHLSIEQIQSLMHDARRSDLPDRTLDADVLMHGIKLLAERGASLPQTILHGDVHPGNIYQAANGKLGFTDWQCIQRGHWSLDAAYHIASVLPIDVAEREERHLLNHYLASLKSLDVKVPEKEAAWKEYRCAPIYGFYQWAITQRVDPLITNQAFKRLGAAVTRHQSYALLGL